MISAMRRFLAILSASGLAAATYAYIGSFAGSTMDALVQWAFVLHIGIFLLMLPMYVVEPLSTKSRTFFWKEFAIGIPRWVVPVAKLLGLICAIHFVIFLVESHAASLQIKDGEFVLNSHGRIVKVLTQSEYWHVKGAELRMFATGWIFFYFVQTMYWWFPRRHQVV